MLHRLKLRYSHIVPKFLLITWKSQAISTFVRLWNYLINFINTHFSLILYSDLNMLSIKIPICTKQVKSVWYRTYTKPITFIQICIYHLPHRPIKSKTNHNLGWPRDLLWSHYCILSHYWLVFMFVQSPVS